MSGKSSQRKGASGERELAALLREYGYDIRRVPPAQPRGSNHGE